MDCRNKMTYLTRSSFLVVMMWYVITFGENEVRATIRLTGRGDTREPAAGAILTNSMANVGGFGWVWAVFGGTPPPPANRVVSIPPSTTDRAQRALFLFRWECLSWAESYETEGVSDFCIRFSSLFFSFSFLGSNPIWGDKGTCQTN